MQKIEDFVNSLDASGIAPAEDDGKSQYIEINVHIDQAAFDRCTITDPKRGTDDDRSVAYAAMCKAIINYNPVLSRFIDQFTPQATEVAYIEVMRRTYGDTLVEAALEDAQHTQCTIYQCIEYRKAALAFNKSFEDLNAAFVKLGEALATGLADVLKTYNDSRIAAANRHNRRAAKHSGDTPFDDKRVQETIHERLMRQRRRFDKH